MARPGQEPGFDYYTLPYNPKWAPLDERQWAERFVDADGTEDWPGFVAEFRTRHKFLIHNHGDSYLPPSVDHYLRHDSMGGRMDIDYELAAIPMTEDELAEVKKIREGEVRERRRAALASRGLTPRGAPQSKSKATQNEVASRMD